MYIQLFKIDYKFSCNLFYKKLANLGKKLAPPKTTVAIYDKKKKEYVKRRVSRKYMSFGESPHLDLKTAKSYMFCHKNKKIPKILQELLNHVKLIDCRFNNVYVNWYDSGLNYIDPHSDCAAKLVGPILIINLNQGGFERTLQIQHKKNLWDTYSIKLTHGLCIFMDSQDQREYWHWVGREPTDQGRISITFRCVDNNK